MFLQRNSNSKELRIYKILFSLPQVINKLFPEKKSLWGVSLKWLKPKMWEYFFFVYIILKQVCPLILYFFYFRFFSCSWNSTHNNMVSFVCQFCFGVLISFPPRGVVGVCPSGEGWEEEVNISISYWNAVQQVLLSGLAKGIFLQLSDFFLISGTNKINLGFLKIIIWNFENFKFCQ